MTGKTLFVWGLHAGAAALEHAPADVLELWVRADHPQPEVERICAQAAAVGVRAQRVPASTLERLAGGAVHQGVVLRRRLPRAMSLDELLATVLARTAQPLVMVIDQVQDPHNLGACLRGADGAGAQAVVVTRDRSAGLTSTVAKVASGAIDSVPLVTVTNLVRALEALQAAGLWAVGATHDAPASIFETDLNRPLALVMGGEGRGLRRLTRERCDCLARIPMQGAVASLNLATAATVALFEAVRQRTPH